MIMIWNKQNSFHSQIYFFLKWNCYIWPNNSIPRIPRRSRTSKTTTAFTAKFDGFCLIFSGFFERTLSSVSVFLISSPFSCSRVKLESRLSIPDSFFSSSKLSFLEISFNTHFNIVKNHYFKKIFLFFNFFLVLFFLYFRRILLW